MNRTFPLFCSLFLIAGSYGQSGANDPSFDPGTGFQHGYGIIHDLSLQPDGKIILIGSFQDYNGGGGQHIVRINSDGSRDESFDVGYGTGTAATVVTLQSDGKVLLGGHFYGYPGSTGLDDLMRLNSDGSFDTSFDSGDGMFLNIGDIVVQPDNKIMISGSFTAYYGVDRARIARINEDGSLDLSFDPGAGATGGNYVGVNGVALQPDGKILIAGNFTAYDGTSRHCIARLNSDGSLDDSFDPGAGPVASGYDDSISRVIVQPDGKVLVFGNFYTFNGVNRKYMARLNADGSLDTGFNIGSGPNDFLSSLALQSDGKIIVGGAFTLFNGATRKRLTRLNADGSTDTSFQPGNGADDRVYTMAIQPDGNIVIAGVFNLYNGVSRNCVARVLVEPGLGIADMASPGSLRIVPNPATDRVSLIGITGGFQWSLYTLQGALLEEGYTHGMLDHGVDVSSLPAGNYFLRAWDGAMNRTALFNKL